MSFHSVTLDSDKCKGCIHCVKRCPTRAIRVRNGKAVIPVSYTHLKKLIGLAPVKGRRLRDGKEEMIPAEEIQQGDILRILPGETIPVDGEIVHGRCV